MAVLWKFDQPIVRKFFESIVVFNYFSVKISRGDLCLNLFKERHRIVEKRVDESSRIGSFCFLIFCSIVNTPTTKKVTT
jgi:hypothetical protein